MRYSGFFHKDEFQTHTTEFYRECVNNPRQAVEIGLSEEQAKELLWTCERFPPEKRHPSYGFLHGGDLPTVGGKQKKHDSLDGYQCFRHDRGSLDPPQPNGPPKDKGHCDFFKAD